MLSGFWPLFLFIYFLPNTFYCQKLIILFFLVGLGALSCSNQKQIKCCHFYFTWIRSNVQNEIIVIDMRNSFLFLNRQRKITTTKNTLKNTTQINRHTHTFWWIYTKILLIKIQPSLDRVFWIRQMCTYVWRELKSQKKDTEEEKHTHAQHAHAILKKKSDKEQHKC